MLLYCSIKLEHNTNSGKVKINTICLPLHATPGETWKDKEATVAGWGYKDIHRKGQWHRDPKVKAGDGKYNVLY